MYEKGRGYQKEEEDEKTFFPYYSTTICCFPFFSSFVPYRTNGPEQKSTQNKEAKNYKGTVWFKKIIFISPDFVKTFQMCKKMLCSCTHLRTV